MQPLYPIVPSTRNFSHSFFNFLEFRGPPPGSTHGHRVKALGRTDNPTSCQSSDRGQDIRSRKRSWWSLDHPTSTASHRDNTQGNTSHQTRLLANHRGSPRKCPYAPRQSEHPHQAISLSPSATPCVWRVNTIGTPDTPRVHGSTPRSPRTLHSCYSSLCTRLTKQIHTVTMLFPAPPDEMLHTVTPHHSGQPAVRSLHSPLSRIQRQGEPSPPISPHPRQRHSPRLAQLC